MRDHHALALQELGELLRREMASKLHHVNEQ